MRDATGGDPQRADLERAWRQVAERERVGHAQVIAAERACQPLLRTGRAVDRDLRLRPGRMVVLRHRQPGHVDAVVGVQMAEADRVDLADPGIALKRAESTVAEVQNEAEITGVDQVARRRAVGAGETA